MKQEVVKIFDDLDALLDFCRFEMLPYNPADLYNKQSKVWRDFENSRRSYKKEWRPRGHKEKVNRRQ
jgi:hypothetical protein